MKMKLGNVCKFIGGGTPSKKNPAFYGGIIPWATVRDMNVRVICETEHSITPDAVNQSATNIIPKGEIVISTHVGLGKVCFLGQDTAINQDLKAVIPDDRLSRRYLYYWFIAKSKDLVSNGKGATVKGVTLDFVKSLEIDVPSLKDQDAVSDTLDGLSHIIELSEEQLERLNLLVKSRFVEMFGNPMANPMRWPIVAMNEVLEGIGNGRSFVCESSPRIGENPAILKLGAATWGEYRPEENKALKPGDSFSPDCEVKAGDLLFTRKNTLELVGKCAYVRATPPKLMLPDLIFRLETRSCIDKVYLANLINCDRFRGQVKKLASGSAGSMPNISKARLMALRIPLPPLALQREFAAFVAKVDKLAFAARRRRDLAQQMYRAKIQEFFG